MWSLCAQVRSVEAFGLQLYPFPPGLAPAAPTASFVGVTRCSLKEKKRKRLQQHLMLLAQQQQQRQQERQQGGGQHPNDLNATIITDAGAQSTTTTSGDKKTSTTVATRHEETSVVGEQPSLSPSPSPPSLLLEQGLVLIGGYLGTCGLQALSFSAMWLGVSTSAGWISRGETEAGTAITYCK